MRSRMVLVCLASAFIGVSQPFLIPSGQLPCDGTRPPWCNSAIRVNQSIDGVLGVDIRQELPITVANLTEPAAYANFTCQENTGSSSCAHIGHPNICCPDIVVISPIGANLERSCFKSNRSTSGVLCCMNPVECEKWDHHPEEVGPVQISCMKGYYECSIELGGQCCPNGYGCTRVGCEHISNGLNITSEGAMPERVPSTPSDGGNQDSGYSLGSSRTEEGMDKLFNAIDAAIDATQKDKPSGLQNEAHPPAHQVLKVAMAGILKSGEIEECIGEDCPENILSSPTDDHFEHTAEAPLTLTHAVGLASMVPAHGRPPATTVSDIVGAVATMAKSDGNSNIQHGSSFTARTFSGHHLRYMGGFFFFQFLNWLPRRA